MQRDLFLCEIYLRPFGAIRNVRATHMSLRSVNMFRSLCKYVVVSSNVRAYSSEFWFIVKRGVRGSVRERRHHESFDIPVVVSKREETLAGTCL